MTAKPPKGARGAVARLADALFARLGSTGRRAVVLLGTQPLHALNQVYPEFNAAVVYLDLRHRIARAYPAFDANHTAARAAREDVEKILDAMTDEHYGGVAKWLRETVGEVPASKSRKSLIDAVRKQLDNDYPPAELLGAAKPKLGTKPLKPAAKAAKAATLPPRTAFDVVDELASGSGEVAHALRTFQQACLEGDEKTIRQTAQQLQDAISKHGKAGGLDWKARDRCRRAVETVVRGFERQAVTAEGLETVLKFWRSFDKLKPTDPMVAVYGRLQSWLSPADLEQLGTAVARLRPLAAAGASAAAKEELADAVAGRVNTLVGKAGEIVGRKGGYRRLFASELRRAANFADSPAGKGWRVRVGRTPVRGLARSGTHYQQFYDDTIMLIDEARGKVALSFTGQFKTGDAASLGVLAQLDSDDVRAGLGKLLVDGKPMEIVTGVIPRRSAIATTMLGVAEERTFTKAGKAAPIQATTDPKKIAAAIGDREIQFLPMPVDPADLRSLIVFMLKAAGKIP